METKRKPKENNIVSEGMWETVSIKYLQKSTYMLTSHSRGISLVSSLFKSICFLICSINV